MGKHNFDRATADNAGNITGAMCSKCGKTVELEGDGNIPSEARNEECRREDFSQAAARIVKEATEEK